MKNIIRFLALVLSFSASAKVQTLRLDYYHTGDSQQEVFSLDRVVVEPLAWPGPNSQVFDNLNRGKYRFIVKNKMSQELLFTRSYSSIYGEWETTAEANKIKRTFHESLRFPMPEDEVIIEIEKRDTNHQFQKVWSTEIDPNHYLNHRESAAYSEQLIAIEQNGDPKHKVDLLILGDGYTAAELAKFKASAKALSEALFATSPFKENRKNFNVWALAPLTNKSGVSRPSTKTYRDSALGVTYDAFGSERYVLTNDNRNFRRIASSAPYDFVEIIVNNDTYGGGGIYGLFSTAAANNKWADYLFIHEFGHHFAGLADEYYAASVAYAKPTNIIEPYEPNVTALLDGETLKWHEKVNTHTPLPTPWPKQAYEKHTHEYQQTRSQLRKANKPESEMERLFKQNQGVVEGMFSKAEFNHVIGAFEGANYSAKGFYRSELNCIMFTRTDDFCNVCQQAIVDVIELYSSE
ncbi:IgA Peptidase M64 [Paraglaciecola aquimarina]|uniref:IgA Peptidase M64 n=1 Tax=Paraglaciecola algarum TaxID=3050085 RepID=A0ABS9D5S5_9ALTE|nr:IgA Peptidase M64 [Paraglaciecola sp. G1-23]MCF2948283.1 IgA Peptidase M64 [Paraglaciecola sp. G1-23]